MKQQPIPREYISIDHYQLAYSRTGQPHHPTIIFVHGWLSSSDVWEHTLAQLCHVYDCITIDHLGHGLSDKVAGADYSVDAHAKRILAVADQLGIGQFALVGHSMGGQIVAKIAGELAPERVTALVHVAGVVTGKLTAFSRMTGYVQLQTAYYLPFIISVWRPVVIHSRFLSALQFHGKYYRQPEDFDSWWLDRYMSMINGIHHAGYRTFKSLVNTDVTGCLSQIQTPVLVMCGKYDGVVPPSEAARAAENLSDYELIEFDQCAHMIMLEQPVLFCDQLLAFLGDKLMT